MKYALKIIEALMLFVRLFPMSNVHGSLIDFFVAWFTTPRVTCTFVIHSFHTKPGSIVATAERSPLA